MALATLFEITRLAVGPIGPVDFALEAGACVSLSGPSGTGKTRLLRAMADLDEHTGHCYLRGIEARDIAPSKWRRQVGYLASETAWWADTVAAHFTADSDTATRTRLQALDLPANALERTVDRLSSGQRQRLALLRLLAIEPAVLLHDEPTANLDADNIARVESLIADYRGRRGAAVVWVGHDPAQRERVADRHIMLDANGHVVAQWN